MMGAERVYQTTRGTDQSGTMIILDRLIYNVGDDLGIENARRAKTKTNDYLNGLTPRNPIFRECAWPDVFMPPSHFHGRKCSSRDACVAVRQYLSQWLLLSFFQRVVSRVPCHLYPALQDGPH